MVYICMYIYPARHYELQGVYQYQWYNQYSIALDT